MWLRPRTELLPADVRWWEFNDDVRWSVLAVDRIYQVEIFPGGSRGSVGIKRIPPFSRWQLICFVVLRSVFLGTSKIPNLATRSNAIRL